MHVVFRAIQLLHGTLRSHLSLVVEVSHFARASMLVRQSHFRWRHSEHDSRARPALMLIRIEAPDLNYAWIFFSLTHKAVSVGSQMCCQIC